MSVLCSCGPTNGVCVGAVRAKSEVRVLSAGAGSMTEAEAGYRPGDVVWVKLTGGGGCWWPGEVAQDTAAPAKGRTKPPVAVVKFFQEDAFEFVKNATLIDRYDCDRKNDFIKKGLNMYRAKRPGMTKFPEDVRKAETLTGGDPDIVDSDAFAPEEKTSYAGLFGSPSDAASPKKGAAGKRGRPSATPKRGSPSKVTPTRTISKNSNYRARILVSDPKDDASVSEKSFDDPDFIMKEKLSANAMDSPASASRPSGMYACHSCNFTSTRLNVLILHNKSHTNDPPTKTAPVKPQKKRVEKERKRPAVKSPAKAKPQGGTKRRKVDGSSIPETPTAPTRKRREAEKPKTDVEIKNSLLADWSEDEEQMDIFDSLKLAENQRSPDAENAEMESPPKVEDRKRKLSEPNPENSPEKVEKQISCFDFDEDEDLSIQTIGRKIPRFAKDDKKTTENSNQTKSPPKREKRATKSRTAPPEEEDGKCDDLDIASLLEETAVPSIPNVPNQLKYAENFQKSRAIKFPDKPQETEEKPPAKSIFKTKTFFRSRHSRSQDAIEKYIADNTTNARSPIYGDDAEENADEYSVPDEIPGVSKLEEPGDAKIVKLAPKIELKKMKATLSDKLQKTATEVNFDSDNDKNQQLTKELSQRTETAEALSDKDNAHSSTSETNDVQDKIETSSPDLIKKSPKAPAINTREIDISDLNNSAKEIVLKNIISENKETKPISKQTSTKCVPSPGKEKILNFDIDRSSTNPIEQSIVLKRSEQTVDSKTFTIEESNEPTVKKTLNVCPSPKKDVTVKDDTAVIGNPSTASTSASAININKNFSKPNIIKQSKVIVKSSSPNILSKSKGKAYKQLLIVDSNGEKKTLIIPKDIQDTPLLQAAANIVKQPTTPLANKTEKFLIVSSNSGNQNSTPLGKRQPKIIRNPPNKTQILLNATSDQLNSPLASKAVQSRPIGEGNTFMIITESGKQPRYIITSDQQKLLLPKKADPVQTVITQKGAVLMQAPQTKGKPSATQTLITSKGQIISQVSGNALITNTGQIIPSPSGSNTNTRAILTAKPNQAILTSKGQFITEPTLVSTQGKNLLTKSPGQQFKLISQQKQINLQQSPVKCPPLKTNQSKLIATQPAEQTILLSPNQGPFLKLTAEEFEQLKKGGQLVIHSDGQSLSQPKIIHKTPEKKPPSTNFILKSDSPSPTKKLKYQEPTKQTSSTQLLANQQSLMEMQNLDELIPATTITTRKVEPDNSSIVPDSQPTQMESPTTSASLSSNQDILAAAASGSLGDGLLAVPGENFGGPPDSFYLCIEENGTFTPINDQPLVLENNQLVPMVTKPLPSTVSLPIPDDPPAVQLPQETVEGQQALLPADQPETNILINFGNQQIVIDQQTLLSLTSGEGQQLVTADGQLLLQGQLQQILTALASNPEISKMMSSNAKSQPIQTVTPDVTPNQDILAAALANTDVFQQDVIMSDNLNIATSTGVADEMIIEMDAISPNFQNLNASVSVHSHVSETSSMLNQPIMSPIEIPTSKKIIHENNSLLLNTQMSDAITPPNLEESLAVIGVTPPSIPSSLDLPITVTNPKIAPKTTNPLTLTCGVVYQSTTPIISPSLIVSETESAVRLNTDESKSYEASKSGEFLLTTITTENETVEEKTEETSIPSDDQPKDGQDSSEEDLKSYPPISMPLLTDNDDAGSKPELSTTIETEVEPESEKITTDQESISEDSHLNSTNTEETDDVAVPEEVVAEPVDEVHKQNGNIAIEELPNDESHSTQEQDADYDLDSEIQPSSVPSETCDSLEQPNSPNAILNMVDNNRTANDNNSLSDQEFNMTCDLEPQNNDLSQSDVISSTPVESDASSECSAEIPLQPPISVTENMIHDSIPAIENEENGTKAYSPEDAGMTNGNDTSFEER